MKKYLFFVFIFVIEIAKAELATTDRYQSALKDAAFVKADGVTNQLWAITPDNSHLIWNDDKTKLLVVLWIDFGNYYRHVKYNSRTYTDFGRFKFWVTAVPQVKDFCKQYLNLSDEDLDLRLKQYLGLPPDGNFNIFVEMWVNPESLFRPCIDPEITDTQCEYVIPDNFIKTLHGEFYQQLYFENFRYPNRYPWTGLGYTYDWGNKESKIGASEFIIKPDSLFIKKGEYIKTRNYCSN